MTTRACKICGSTKPIEEFGKPDHRRRVCHDCNKVATRVRGRKARKKRRQAKPTIKTCKICYRKGPSDTMFHRYNICDKCQAIRYRETRLKFSRNVRAECLHAYGDACVGCGETDSKGLCLDHVLNDAYKDKFRGGIGLYLQLKKAGWPKDRYQILCATCNQIKQLNGGVLPADRRNANLKYAPPQYSYEPAGV